MSDLSVASASHSSALQPSRWAQIKSLFDQLGTALQSGDLSAAKKAFSALQQYAPKEASAQNKQADPTQKAFTALAQALQSGDLSAAQQAFSQIQQAGGRHRHHHHQESQAGAIGTGGDTVDIKGNTGTINIVESSKGSSAASGAETINITGNTGTINITI